MITVPSQSRGKAWAGQIVGRAAVDEDHAVLADLIHGQFSEPLFDVRAKVDAVFETAQFRVRLDRAAVHALHGAPVVQFLKVLAQGGLGDAHLLGEVGDDHAAAVGDALEDELLTFCLHHAGLLRLVYAVAGR